MSNSNLALAKVPVFQLYGEDDQPLAPDLIHCESIASRSRLHNWEIRPHRHHGLFQVLWLEQGEANFQLDGRRGQLSAGRVLLLPQHCVHGFTFAKEAQGMVVTFAYSLLAKVETHLAQQLMGLAEPVHCQLSDLGSDGMVEAGLRALHLEYQQRDAYRQTVIESLLNCILAWVIRKDLAQTSDQGMMPVERARQHLTHFITLIDANYAKHIPLEQYAVSLEISVAHLNAICRQVSGRSALQLIHERLMLEAKRELIYTVMTIKEISEFLGFTDPAYFTRFFKRQEGMSPRDFRLQSSAAVRAA
jgi:AraC family transcriptional activator of pobA